MMKMEYLVQQDMIQREKQEMQQIYGSKKRCRQENRLEIGDEEINILKKFKKKITLKLYSLVVFLYFFLKSCQYSSHLTNSFQQSFRY